MRVLRITVISALLATPPLILAHELMHGFGGALFGHGAVIKLNGANPQGLVETGPLVVFALSGTAYLFYVTILLLWAFRKRRRPHLLGVSLAAGTVHQVSFFEDLLSAGISGALSKCGSDPFHAGAVLWNNGPLSGCDLPWREITFTSGWPSFLIITLVVITFVIWGCLSWEVGKMATNRKRKRTLLLPLAVSFIGIFFPSIVISGIYTWAARTVDTLTGWAWSVSPTSLMMFGIVLLIIPIVVWWVEAVSYARPQSEIEELPGSTRGRS